MKNHSHLMKVDPLLVRSCLYLMPLEEQLLRSTNINPELLDILHVFTNKVPQEITASSSQVSENLDNSGKCRLLFVIIFLKSPAF